jgi:hypothetical protein
MLNNDKTCWKGEYNTLDILNNARYFIVYALIKLRPESGGKILK